MRQKTALRSRIEGKYAEAALEKENATLSKYLTWRYKITNDTVEGRAMTRAKIGNKVTWGGYEIPEIHR